MSTCLQPGDRCAGHEIVQHLGTGGSAEVYATRAPTGELRALKIMAVDRAAAPSLPACFAQEGEALALIVHPPWSSKIAGLAGFLGSRRCAGLTRQRAQYAP